VPTARDIAYISAPVVKWARDRAGLSHEELATQLSNVNASQVQAWEQGTSLPTFSQAEKLAEKLRLPFAVLFLDEPPKITLPIPDLRTVAQATKEKPSLEFFDVVSDALLRQRWYREYQEEHEATPLAFVGSFGSGADVNDVAEDMARYLGINEDLRNECTTWQQFFVAFVQRAESLGVLVMRSGVVRHNPTRTLEVEEFRGFAISDELAPLVFINSRDARAAQIFTLAHELAHIWIGASGISNPAPKKRRRETAPHEVEHFCNQVAAQLLIPAAGLEQFWAEQKSVPENIRRIATHYRVSSMVALRRAYDLEKISYPLFSRLIDEEYKKFEKVKKEDEEGGGNFWASFAARNSPTFVRAIVGSLRQDKITYRDAANLLGVKVKTLLNYPGVKKVG
jgi:Zn-dependent peptidase ImmA (M78 family)/transcriptional regulator with XRE-family HTH domain